MAAGSLREFERLGYAVVDRVLDAGMCDTIAERIGPTSERTAGSRTLLAAAWCRELAHFLKQHAELATMLPAGAVAVQCTLFDKSPQANWLVALHQDLSIPVGARVPHPELTGWSRKEGVLYVQPPASLLEALVAVRVHLDDSTADRGPLRVVPGSHRDGRFTEPGASARRDERGETECLVGKGGVLLMRPLLLHASSKASRPSRRRVLHFLFGPAGLPWGLRWHDAV